MAPGWSIMPVYQPIVALGTGDLFAVEALSRFIGRGLLDTGTVFAQADATGVRTDLELLALRSALPAALELPAGTLLSLNVSAPTLRHPLFPDALRAAPADRLVLELTHTATAELDAAARTVLSDVRTAGARLAVDDIGAGSAALLSLVELAPELVKVDIALVRGVDTDPARAAMVRALASYARETGAQVIAEGVQSIREVAALQAAGVDLGQGFALGRPETLDVFRSRGLLASSQ